MRTAFGVGIMVALGVCPAVARAATIMVGPMDSYAKIEAAQPGDEVVIAPGTYKFRVYLTQKAPANAPIVIRAQDPKNPPIWDLTGTLVENAPGSYGAGDRGRGCWQLSGATNIRISGITFQGCRTASNNSAGIRYFNGASVAIKDCVFRLNDNGLTGGSQNSTATVEFSEFDRNGNLMAGAPTHNIYIYGGTYTMRYSYLHDPVQAQNFHVRAHDAVIEYNWIARAASYEGDLMTDDDCPPSGPCTQNMLLRGNLILQGNPANKSQVVAVFNDTGVAMATMNLRMVNNTAVLGFANSNLVHLSNADGTTMSAEISNNLLSGGKPYLIENTGKGTASGSSNWMPTGTTPGALSGTVFGTNPFKNAGAKDFTLAMGSTAIAAASGAVMGLPDREYYKDEAAARMYRLRLSVKDIGAFESTTSGGGVGPYDTMPSVDGGVPDGDGGVIGDAGGSVGDGGGSDGGTNPSKDAGCGCEASASAALGGWPVALAMLALLRRRARRA